MTTTPDARADLLDAARAAFAAPFGGVLLIAPEGLAPFAVDGRGAPVKLIDPAPADLKTDVAFRGPKDVFARILAGERALESAYVSGRLSIAGDMSAMARMTLKEDL